MSTIADRLTSFKQGPAQPTAAVVETVFVPETSADELSAHLDAQPNLIDGALDQSYKVYDKKQVVGRKTTGTVVVYASSRYSGKLKVVLTGSLMGVLASFPGVTQA